MTIRLSSRLSNVKTNTLTQPSFDTLDLTRRAQAGDREAFVKLVELFQDELRRVIMRYVGDAHIADDLAQEVFVAAFRTLRDLADPAKVKAWLFTIARNKSMTHLRREITRRKANGELLEAKLTEFRVSQVKRDDADDIFAKQQSNLKSCLAELSENHRELIEQFYYLKLSAESIAKESGRKSGTVRMMLLRIRQALAKCINRKMGGAG